MSMTKEGYLNVIKHYGSIDNYKKVLEKKFYLGLIKQIKKKRNLTKQEEKEILEGKKYPNPYSSMFF